MQASHRNFREVSMDSSKIDLYHVHPAYPLAFAFLGVLMVASIMFYECRVEMKSRADVGAVQTEPASTGFMF